MDRMGFVPGPDARKEIENAQGRIIFGRQTALDIADEFLFGGPCCLHPTLYALVGACVSEDDQVEINFGLRDPIAWDEVDASGELVGYTWATLTEGQAKRKTVLWEVGRRTAPIHDSLAQRAFNLYRNVLADSQNVPAPAMVPLSSQSPTDSSASSNSSAPPAISRALSPSNLYDASGSMFYFVELNTSAPGTQDYPDKPSRISRPMRASDALKLAALLTMATGSPPLVFAVLQSIAGLGKIPETFERRTLALEPKPEPDEGKVAIVG